MDSVDGIASGDTLLQIRGLSVCREGHEVLRSVSLQVGSTERVSIEGPIGSGKTTLLWSAMGLVERTAGEVVVFGSSCRSEGDFVSVRGQIALMFQDSDDQLIGPTVLEDVEFGPLNLGIDREESRRRAMAALAALRVSALADRAIRFLSGGQKRLVALAGLIALQPRLLLLDEPTASLDAVSASHIIEALDSLSCAMLLVSHDQRCVQALSTRRLLLDEGVLSEATTGID